MMKKNLMEMLDAYNFKWDAWYGTKWYREEIFVHYFDEADIICLMIKLYCDMYAIEAKEGYCTGERAINYVLSDNTLVHLIRG